VTLLSCTQPTESTKTETTGKTVGFAGSPDNSWMLGSQENLFL
jgi:hypothetical protein